MDILIFRNKVDILIFRNKVDILIFRDKVDIIIFRDKLDFIIFRDKVDNSRTRRTYRRRTVEVGVYVDKYLWKTMQVI